MRDIRQQIENRIAKCNRVLAVFDKLPADCGVQFDAIDISLVIHYALVAMGRVRIK